MKNRRIILACLSFVTILLFTVACEKKQDEMDSGKKMTGQTYKLGLSLAITGPTSDAGAPYSKGVEDYCKYTNDKQLLGNDKVDCLIKDDAYNTDVTKRNFEEFIESGMVLYLNYSTGSTLSLKKDFEETKMPTIPASFHAGNLVDSTYVFLPIASYSEEVLGLAEYIVQNHQGPKAKVAMFIHPSAFGRAPVDDIQKAVVAGLNIEIVEVVEHGKDLDNTAMLQRLVSKGAQYLICHSVQSPVATMLKDAQRLSLVASTFGEKGKLTFLGAHYTGGNDLIALAGTAAESYYWITSYTLTSEPSAGTTFQLDLAKQYNRDDKTANSHNYTNGIMVTQVAVEAIKRAKEKSLEITKANLYGELNAMNGDNAYNPNTTVGPVTYSPTDHVGVDSMQLYVVKDGVFKSVGSPYVSEFMKKIK
jgi:branched-chain amino acid transport system substrate-binding protein